MKVYMVCDSADGKAREILGTPNVGVEHMGGCCGRILREDGTEIGCHHSSSVGWLRADLRSKLDNPDDYEIIDLIDEAVPERFRLNQETPPLDGSMNQIQESLEAAEWPPSEIDGTPNCSCCGNMQMEGHADDCQYGNFLTALRTGKLAVVDGDDFTWLLKHIDLDAPCTDCPVRQMKPTCYEFGSCADAFKAYLQGEMTPDTDYRDEIDAETAGDWKAHEELDRLALEKLEGE